MGDELGNLAGSLFVAYFLAVKTGVVTADLPLARLGQIAEAKGHTETELQIFLRGVGCNWLVCLAVWMSMAAEDVSGKILAIFFPIMGFVAIGLRTHVVANMFFLPAAIFAHVPGITWGDALHNWALARSWATSSGRSCLWPASTGTCTRASRRPSRRSRGSPPATAPRIGRRPGRPAAR